MKRPRSCYARVAELPASVWKRGAGTRITEQSVAVGSGVRVADQLGGWRDPELEAWRERDVAESDTVTLPSVGRHV